MSSASTDAGYWQSRSILGVTGCQDLQDCHAFPVVIGSISAALRHTAAVLGSDTTRGILHSKRSQGIERLDRDGVG